MIVAVAAAVNLWRLVRWFRPQARQLPVLVLAGAAATASTVAVALLVRRAADGPVTAGDRAGLVGHGLLVLLFGLVEVGAVFARRWLQARIALDFEARLRARMFAHLQQLGHGLVTGWPAGQLLSRATGDVAVLRRFLSFGLVFLTVNTATCLVVLGVVLYLYWPLGLVVAAGAVPLLAASRRFTSTYLMASRRLQDQQGDLATLVQESAHGISVIKAFGRRRHMAGRFRQAVTGLHDTAVGRTRQLARTSAQIRLATAVTTAVVVVAGAVQVAGGTITIGTLIGILLLQLALVWPVDALGWIIANAREAMTAADRICEVLDTRPAIWDRAGATVVHDCAGHVRFDRVAFRYPGSPEAVLCGVDLMVRPGETLAVVGATGCGKTTLLSLVPRLYDVGAGSIRLDGRDIRDIRLASLRRLVGTAFEDPVLFSMSVRENLTLGRPEATDEEIREAIEVAQADFVDQLPWGWDTRIGEQGLSLSGGQRQRLALARAVLCRPRVLILDDPLSALDVHTEALVEKALTRVLHGTTALLAAHRPSTVALADRVALLTDGRITAVGTHTELLATTPEYRALWPQT